MTIGDRIRAKRQDLGLSVDELAARLGKNRATVYRYENGNIESLPVGILEPLATALETTPAYLIGLVDSAVPSTPSEPTITNNLPDKANAAEEKRFDRYKSRRSNDSAVDVTTKAAPIVKRYIHEKFGVRRVKMDDIKVVKHGGRYTVTYHKHAAQLH